MTKEKSTQSQSQPLIEELDSRTLFSADVEGLLVTDLSENTNSLAITDSLSPQTDSVSITTPVSDTHELVIIDTNTPDYETLVQDLVSNIEKGQQIYYAMLDSSRDGIEQISQILSEYQELDAVHIISHGSEGAIDLGGTQLDTNTLDANQSAIQEWAQAFSEDGDLLLYGCDLASSEAGRFLIDSLANLTGADVAASDDLTGSAQLGGDWNLEYNSGQIEADTLMTDSSTGEWQGLLAGQVLESFETSFNNLADFANEVKSGGGYGQSFIYDSPDSTYEVSQIDLVVYKDPGADPGQTITVTLRDAFNGTILGSSATVSSDDLATSEAWVSFDIGSATLNDNVQYVIQIDSDGGGKVYLGVYSSIDIYTNGDLLDKDGNPQALKDAPFRVIGPDNTAPVATGNTVVTNEDIPLVIDASDFLFTDAESDALTSVTISALNLNGGALTHSSGNVTVANGMTITAAQLADLTFTSALNDSTNSSFSYTVNDADPGTFSAVMNITVNAVNDAPTFLATTGGDGISTTDISTGQDTARSVMVQPDGKILVAGYGAIGGNDDFALARYNTDGSLDTSFDGDGMLTTSIGSFADYAYSATLQTDGKILLAGHSNTGSGYDFALVRYNTDGSLDTSFNGDGKVTTDFGSGGSDYGYSTTVQADGKILVAGISHNGTNYDFALVRYNTDGTLDTSFDTDGKVTTAIGSGYEYAYSVTVQTDGKILVAGNISGTDFDFALVRYNTDGTLDTSFSTDGMLTTAIGTADDEGNSVAVQTDGKILVSGYSFNGTDKDFAVVRYNTDGTLDTSFSADGKLTTDIGAGDDTSYSITLQTDGKILLSGNSFNGIDNDFAVVRYNTDGTLDTSFSSDGILTSAIGSGDDNAYSVSLQADGKILVAGDSSIGGNIDFALIRYNSDGTLDTSFDSVQINTLDGTPTFTQGTAAVVLDASVEIVDAELSAADNFSGATLTLIRNGGANADDVFSASGNLAALTESGNLTLSGTIIGTVTTNSAGTLELTFNSSATQDRVNETLQSITYANSNGTPPASVQVDWSFDDGNTGTQGTGGALSAAGSTLVNIVVPATMQMITGSYVGDGVGGRSITGLGFAPDLVIIKQGASGENTVARTSSMTGDVTKSMVGGIAEFSGGIQSFNADGFRLGTDSSVNAAGQTYYWTAFVAADGEMSVGTYTGDGTDNRSITGIGFQSDYAIVMGAGTQESVQRFQDQTGDMSLEVGSSAVLTNVIQAFEADGFQVGSDNRVNQAGEDYYYITWKEVAGKTAFGTYAGDGVDNRAITDVGFQSDYVLVTLDGGGDSVHRADSLTGDNTLGTGIDGVYADGIQQFISTGFEVGTHPTVNLNGQNYYYAAFNADADNIVVTETFQQGVSGYTGTQDTYTDENFSTANNGSLVEVAVDIDDGAGDATTQGLLRFDNIFGAGAGQIPVGATINSAELTVYVTNVSNSVAQITLHSMLIDWNEASTWDSTVNGVGIDNIDASSSIDSTLASPDLTGSQTFTGLAAALQAWSDGAANYGWVISTDNDNGWDFASSENSTVSFRPVLTVDYSASVNSAPAITSNGGGATANINVAENTTAVTTVTATDADLDTRTFSITGGADQSLFNIDLNSGVLTLNNAPNYESPADANADNVYEVTVQADDGAGGADIQNIDVTVRASGSLWLTTKNDVTSSGVTGLNSWTNGTIIEFGDPNLSLDPGTTDGTLSAIFNLDDFAQDSDAKISGLHVVSSDITVGGTSSFDLKKGDLILSTKNDETLNSTNSLFVNSEDAFVFRPDTLEDYSSGSFYLLIDSSDIGLSNITGLTLVEQDTVVGGATLNAGTFLLNRASSGDIYHFTATNVGTDTSGSTSVLVDGSDLGISDADALLGVELIEEDIYVGDTLLQSGQILASIGGTNSEIIGDNNVTVSQMDIFLLDVVTSGTSTAANVTLLFDGSDAGFDVDAEKVQRFSLHTHTNTPPVITSDGGGATANINVAENTTAVTTVIATDADLDTVTYSLDPASDDDSFFTIDSGSGVLTFTAAPDFETPADLKSDNVYEVTVKVDDGNGGVNTQAISVTVTNINEAPAGADKTVTTNEDTDYIFTVVDFSFSDVENPDDSVLNVIITTAPSSGTLYLDANLDGVIDGSETLIATSVVSVADITAGKLKFHPATNVSGTGYDSFTFQVQDDGGTANGGVDTDQTPNTITIDVNAANDAPTFSVGNGTTITAIGANSDLAQSSAIQADGKLLVAGSSTNGGFTDFALARYNINGTLDTTFNGTGIVTTAIGSGSDTGLSIIVQADGKILVVGLSDNGSDNDFALVRYNTDGTLDATFNGTGKVTTAIGTSDDEGYSVTIQADGKILVAGNSDNGSNHDFALVRYNTDGTLDATFNGTGKVTTDIGADEDYGKSVTVQTDGKILVSGYSNIAGSDDFSIVRYNADGTLDTTFNGTGKVSTAIGTSIEYGNSVTVQTDGKILVAGYSFNTVSINFDFAVVRYNIDGTLDTTFNGTGKVTTDIGSSHDMAYSIILQDDGKILVAGSAGDGSQFDFSIVRYNTDGTLDTTFNGTGMVTTAIGASDDYGYSTTLQTDGKIVVTGYSLIDSNFKFSLARYNADGTLDNSFNPINTLDGTPTFIEDGPAVILDADVQIFDEELSAADDFSNATLTLVRNGAANAEDIFSATGNLSALTESGNLVLSAVTIGTVTTNSAGTLVLTFNTNATQARVNETQQSIAYANSSDTPPASVQIDWTFNDANSGAQGAGSALEATGSTTVTINSVNDEPSGTDKTVATNEDTDYVFTTSDFGFTDTDGNALLNVIIGAAPSNGILYLDANLDGVIDGGETLIASGVVSVADITSGKLKFQPASEENGVGYDTFTFQVQDDGGTANSGVDTDQSANTITIDVTAVNDAPALAANPLNPTFTEGGVAVTPYNFVSADPLDSGQTIEELVLTITNVTDGNDELINFDGSTFWLTDLNSGTTATNSYGYSVSLAGNTATLTLTTTGASIADISSLFINLSYENGNDAPTTIDRVFTITSIKDSGGTANGGVDTLSPNLVSTVTVVAVNDAATATNLNAAEAYTEDATLNLIDIVVSDADSANVTATLTLSDTGAGSLSIATSGAVTSTFVGGVWSASGAIADVNTLLAGVTFTPTLNYNSNFTIATSVDDGVAAPITGSKVVTATAVNDQLTTNASIDQTQAYTEGDPSVVLDDIVVSDVDSGEVITATLTLAIPATGTLTVSGAATYTVGTGVWTITDMVANVNIALANVAFVPETDNDIDTSIAVNIVDGGEDGTVAATGTITLDVTPVNDAPIITIDATNLGYFNGDGAVDIDPALVVSDDNATLVSAKVKLGLGFITGEDALVFTDQLGITGSFNTSNGLLTLTGVASVADYQTALRSVQYEDVNAPPTPGLLNIRFSVNDGTFDSVVDVRIVELIDDERPRISNDAGIVLEGGSVLIDLAANDNSADAPLDLNSIVITNAPAYGNVVINGDGTITYTHTDDDSTTDSFTYTIDDTDPTTSNEATVIITITPANDAPTFTALAQNPTYTEGDPAVILFGFVNAFAVENGQTFEELVFTVTNVSDGNDERIHLDGSSFALSDLVSGTTVTNGYGYSVSLVGNTATVTVTTTGADALDITVLGIGIRYENTSEDPTILNRVVTITSIKDSGGTSNGGIDTFSPNLVSTVTVVAANDTPTATNLNQTIGYNEGDGSVAITDIVVTDVDSGETITATLTLADPTYGSLTTSGTATYTAGTGTWKITDTLVNVNAALASVAFVPTTNNDLDTSITTHIEDAAATGPTDGSIALNVTAANDAPTATNLNQTIGYNEGDGSVAITDIVITDVDSDETITATLTLADPTYGSLTVSGAATYTAGTGIWTITDTLVNINAALASVAFVPTTNNDLDTSINTHIEDAAATGPADGSITLNVTSANDAPTAINLNQTIGYTEDDVSVAIADIVVTDVDTGETITATLTLADSTYGSLTVSGTASYTAGTGVWTITDTVANVNTALANVTFIPTTNNDLDTSITTHIEDAVAAGPADGSIALNVTAANDAPTDITPSKTTTSVTVLNPGFEAQTLSLSGGSNSITDWTTTGGHTGVWHANTAGYTDQAPDGDNVGFIDEGGTISQTISTTFTAGQSYTLSAMVGDPGSSAIDNSGWEMRLYAGGQLLGSVSNADFNPDNDEFIKATLYLDEATLSTFSAQYGQTLTIEFYDDNIGDHAHFDDVKLEYTSINVAENVIDGTAVSNITSTTDADTGDTHTYTLTDDAGGRFSIDAAGVITVADGSLLDYESASIHTITVRSTDAGGLFYDEVVTIEVTDVNDAPSGADKTVTTNEDTDYVFTAADFGFTDVESDAFLNVVVTTAPANGVLYLDTNLDGVIDGGETLIATSLVSVADITAGKLKFQPVTSESGTSYDSFTFQVQDDGGVANSGVDTDQSANTITINVTDTNNAAVISIAGSTLAYTEGDGATVIDNTLTITDVDDTNIESATISISGGLITSEDVLAFTSSSGITGGYTTGTGILALSGTATLAQYETVLESVTYQNTNGDNPNTGNRTVTWVVNDGDTNSTGVTSTVTVAAQNDVSTVSGVGSTLAYTEGDSATIIDSTITITDVDDTLIEFANISIASGWVNSEDVLAFTAANGITGSYNATTGVLSLSGTATLADYEAALESVTYENTNTDNPNTSNRTINWTVHDGSGTSGDVVSTVTVAAQNDAPTATNLNQTIDYTEGDLSVGIADIVVTDVDTGETITATLTLADPTYGSLTTSGAATYTAGTGIWTITDTVANVNTALASVAFVPTTDNEFDTSITTHIEDAAAVGPTDGSIALNVIAVNDAPTATNLNQAIGYTEGDASVAITDIVVSDVDDSETITAILTLADPTYGSLTTSGTATYTASTGIWTITDTVANVNTALVAVAFVPLTNNDLDTSITTHIEDAATAAPADGSIVLNVTAVNDTPVNLIPTTQTVDEDQTLIFSTSNANAITIKDIDNNGNMIEVTIRTYDSATIALSGNGGLIPVLWSTTPGTLNYELTGTIAQVNAELEGMAFSPANNFTGTTALRVTTDDLGNTGGASLTDIDTVNINVISVNDAPVRTSGVVNNLVVVEDAALTSLGLSGVSYGVGGGADEGGQNLVFEVTTIPDPFTFGKIYLANGTTQVATGFYSLADLQGMQFSPVADVTGGPVLFSFRIQDSGGTANGGVDTLNESLQITITALNDAPTADAISTSGNEDAAAIAVTLTGSDIDGTVDFFQLSSLPANGALYTDAGLTNTAAMGVDYAATTEALTLYFAPDLNWNGITTFDYVAKDNSGLLGVTPATATLTVNAINDAPVAVTHTVSTIEDNAYTFSVSDFSFSDVEGDSLVSITLSNLNLAGGTLEHTAGVTVTNGMTLSATELATLVYAPLTNATGAALAAFDFTINDADLGVVASQMVIDVIESPAAITEPIDPTGPVIDPVIPVTTPDPVPDNEDTGPGVVLIIDEEVDPTSSHGEITPDPEPEVDPEVEPEPVLPEEPPIEETPPTIPEKVAEVVEMVEAIPGEILATVMNKIDGDNGIGSLTDHTVMWRSIDVMLHDIDQAFSEEEHRNNMIAYGMKGMTFSLSAGFVAWALRGGSLLATALTTIPIWRGLDPLPVLAMSSQDRRKESKLQKQERENEDDMQAEIGKLIDGATLDKGD